jgi:transcriptional regulator with XRE-family HTH domain
MQYIALDPNVQYIAAMSESNELLHHVGAHVRALRHERGWTQQALAERSHVSVRMLAAIEGGNSNVSLGTLDRLAHALGITFAELVREPTSARRAAEPTLVWRGTDEQSYARLLQSVPGRGAVELWEWSLSPGERYAAEADRPGMVELIYVMEGALTLELQSGRETVAAGRSLAHPSDRAYAYVNEGEGPVRFIRNVVG